MRWPMFPGPWPLLLLFHNWSYNHILNYFLLAAWALDQQVSLIEHIILPKFTLLPPAFQLGSRKKQTDASVSPDHNPSRLPSIVLEVGSSESITQLKIDAKLWLETVPEVSQFLPLLPLTHQNVFRYN